MKLQSISGTVFHVRDIAQTIAFYEQLGFRVGNQNDDTATVYVNWFWIEFQSGAQAALPAGSQQLCCKVDDVTAFYSELVAQGIAATEPVATTSGRRECHVVDPDEHTIVFFDKVK